MSALMLSHLGTHAAGWLQRLGRPDVPGPQSATEFYLAGSAGLALYCAHRVVDHLDLMSAVVRLAPADRRDLLMWLRTLDPDLVVETARDGYLFVRGSDGVGLQFFWYPYPLIEPTVMVENLEVASLVDLGLMKLGAVISRSTLRDLRDLEVVSQSIGLDLLLERAPEKFGHVADFGWQAIKALAEREPLAGSDPNELARLSLWARGWARRLGQSQLGLVSPG